MKKKLIGIVAATCLLSAIGAVATTQFNATDTLKASASTEATLIMAEGAAVRLKTDKDEENVAVNGLRFEAQMPEAYYDALTGTEVVLKSTATAKASNGEDLSKTVEWTLKSATAEIADVTFANGVAKFYHTITFDSLFGEENAEKLKAANAMEFTANFSLESDVDSEDWTSETQTRSMRQVAYAAYTTPGTDTQPNAGYQNATLLNYFSQGAGQKAYAQSIGDTSFLTEATSKADIGT